MKNNILNSKKTKHIILIILSTIYLLASIKSVFFVAFGVALFRHPFGDRLYVAFFQGFVDWDITTVKLNSLFLALSIICIIWRIASYCLVFKKSYIPFAIGVIIDAVIFYAMYIIPFVIIMESEIEAYPIYGSLINLIFAAIYILIAKVKRKNDEIVKGD